MTPRVALLRAVNVAGSNKLPMVQFRALLSDLGLRRVETYIQSGNAVFDSDLPADRLETMIRDAIASRHGFAPETFVLDATEMGAALTDHPFAGADGNLVHVYFLKEPSSPDDVELRALVRPGDDWHPSFRRFTLYTPGGVGTSKLAARLPKLLPAPMTARNLRTVAALHSMLSARR